VPVDGNERGKRRLRSRQKTKYQTADTPGYFVIELEIRIRKRPRIDERLSHESIR
jgi:hypothetical protein